MHRILGLTSVVQRSQANTPGEDQDIMTDWPQCSAHVTLFNSKSALHGTDTECPRVFKMTSDNQHYIYTCRVVSTPPYSTLLHSTPPYSTPMCSCALSLLLLLCSWYRPPDDDRYSLPLTHLCERIIKCRELDGVLLLVSVDATLLWHHMKQPHPPSPPFGPRYLYKTVHLSSYPLHRSCVDYSVLQTIAYSLCKDTFSAIRLPTCLKHAFGK